MFQLNVQAQMEFDGTLTLRTAPLKAYYPQSIWLTFSTVIDHIARLKQVSLHWGLVHPSVPP